MTAEIPFVPWQRVAAAFVEQTNSCVALLSPDGRVRQVNKAFLQRTGKSAESLADQPLECLGVVDLASAVRKAMTERQSVQLRSHATSPSHLFDAFEHWVVQPMFDQQGEPEYLLVCSHGESQHTRAEDLILKHARFLESLDRVNSAIHGAGDLEQMMSRTLDATLEIFGCDRAWLTYPCDLNASTWSSPMERTRPEYPGSLAMGIEHPLDEDTRHGWSLLLSIDGPATFGPGNTYPLPEPFCSSYQIRAFITMVLRPKVGLPWLFGLHQCSHARNWSLEEQRLFQQIGRRLTDGLTGLISHLNLEQREQRFRSLAENSPDLISRVDRDGRYIYINPAVEAITGLPPQAFIGTLIGAARRNAGQDNDDSVGEPLRAAVRSAFSTGEQQRCTVELPDGALFDYSVAPERDALGNLVSAVCIARDTTGLRRSEIAQRRLNRSLRLLSATNQLLIQAEDEKALLGDLARLAVEVGGYELAWISLTGSGLLRPSVKYGRLTGAADDFDARFPFHETNGGPTGDAVEKGQLQLVQDIDRDPRVAQWRELLLERGLRSSASLLLKHQSTLLGTLTLFSPETHPFSAQEVELLQEMAGDLAFGITAMRTRAEHNATQEKLAFLAHHDPLTRLPNRLQLRNRFKMAISGARRSHEHIAMLFLDLDNFKEINDTLGHEVGDKLLVRVAERLQAAVPSNTIVSREGGDEFVVIMSEVADREHITQLAQKILASIEQPFHIGGSVLHITLSIGISIYPDDGTDFEHLRRNSDAALFHAKDRGRNLYHFFDERLNVDAATRLEINAQLRAALKKHEFELFYQPQVSLRDNRIVGVEALLRWRPGGGALMAPSKFIPIAEKTGLIVPIGEWVLNEACRQIVAWRKAGLPDLVVAINLSVVQFGRGNIVEAVTSALERSGAPATSLELELTESVLVQDTEGTLRTLEALKSIGVTLAIDDFGTGYSSLAYVKRLAVDKLKIAQPFVDGSLSSAQDAAIVRAIVQLGHTLQLDVIAEGVETDAQLRFLRTNGCDQVQGYLISHPLPAAEALSWLKQPRWQTTP